MRKAPLQPIIAKNDFSTRTDLNFRNQHREIERLQRHFYTGQTSAPTAANDLTEGHGIGTIWIDEAADEAYICLDNTTGAAVWLNLSSGAVVTATATVLAYNEAATVTDNVLTTVTTYTAGASGAKITGIMASGQIYGKWEIYINSVLKITKRGGPDRNVDFDFDIPLSLANGDILDVKVIHFSVGQTPDFEAAIIGYI